MKINHIIAAVLFCCPLLSCYNNSHSSCSELSKNASRINKGMSKQQVSSILGKPDNKSFQTQIIKGRKTKMEIWEYSSQAIKPSSRKPKTVMEAVEEEQIQRQVKNYYTGERCGLFVCFFKDKVVYSSFSQKNRPLKRVWE